jgi:hypothetical protein
LIYFAGCRSEAAAHLVVKERLMWEKNLDATETMDFGSQETSGRQENHELGRAQTGAYEIRASAQYMNNA